MIVRLSRFRLRTLMIAVALAAALLALGVTAARSRTYRALAEYHAAEEALCLRLVRDYESGRARAINIGPEEMARAADRLGRLATYHASLKRKYASAAARPWVRAAPDPPVPR